MTPRVAVGVRRYMAGSRDAHGNPAPSWGAPEERLVYAVYPRSTAEPLPERTAVTSYLSLLAPEGFQIGSQDRVVVNGVEYDVDGDPADWTLGPFGWNAGVEIPLKKIGG